VRGALELQRGSPGAAYELLIAAARGVATEDPARSLELQAQAITASFVAGWPERAFVEGHVVVKDLPPTGKPYQQFLRVFLAAMAATDVTARNAAREQLLEDVRMGAAAGDFRFMGWAGIASAYLGDLRTARVHCMRALASARATGSFSGLPVALLGPARLAVGDRAFDEADEFAREGLELTRQLAQENLETIFSGRWSVALRHEVRSRSAVSSVRRRSRERLPAASSPPPPTCTWAWRSSSCRLAMAQPHAT
jgi:hypothetical protein